MPILLKIKSQKSKVKLLSDRSINYARKCLNKPVVLPIKRIVHENETMRSFYFDYRLNSKPGQFVMLWIPGIDEKPFAVASDKGNVFFLTIACVGPATAELFKLKEGDKVGIRGPYGNFFQIRRNQKLVLVGGGYGSAVLFSVLDSALSLKCSVDFIIGARTKDMFILHDKIRKYSNVKLHVSTNDGSLGVKGFSTDVLYDLLNHQKALINAILTCGPEMMMKKVSDIAWERKIPCQLSFERYMKCGFGVCGNCALDPDGLLACKDGTIFDNETVRGIADFGQYHRDAEGRKIIQNSNMD